MEFVNFLPMHRYSVDIFSYSGPSGILESGRKQNTSYPGAWQRENFCMELLNFSVCINIVLIFFSYSCPSGILCSCRKQNTA